MSDRNVKPKSDEDTIYRCKQCRKVCKGKLQISQHKRDFHPELIQSLQKKLTEASVSCEDGPSTSNEFRLKPGEIQSLPAPSKSREDYNAKNFEELKVEKPALKEIDEDNVQSNYVPEINVTETVRNSPEVINLVSSSDNSSRESSPEPTSILRKPSSLCQETKALSQNVFQQVQDAGSDSGHNTLEAVVPEKHVMQTLTFAAENVNLEFAERQHHTAANVSAALGQSVTVTTRYKCSVCTKFFPTTGALRMHMARHPKQRKQRVRRIKCRYCTTTFSTAVNRDTHESYEHPNALHFLEKRHGRGRGRSKKTRRDSVEDVVDLTDRENFLPFKCTECKESFAKERLLSQHMRTHSMYQCALCKDQFEREYDFKTHLKRHLPKKRKRPVFKQTSFLTYPKDCYEKEVKDPDGKPDNIKLKLFKVPELQTPSGKQKPVIYWSAFSNQGRTTEIKSAKVYDFTEDSPTCDEKPVLHTPSPAPSNTSMFSTPEMPALSRQGSLEKSPAAFNLSSDVMKANSKDGRSRPRRRLECTLCKRNFNKTTALVRHFRNHFSRKNATQRQESQCPACEQKFSIRARLYAHCRKVHGKSIRALRNTSESSAPLQAKSSQEITPTSFEEQILQKARDYSTAFTPPMPLLHPQLDNFQSLTPASRNSGSDARPTSATPKRRVVKRHSCAVCGKCFNFRSNLARHEEIHDRPFPCELCEKQFSTENQLEAHHSTSHVFECGECGKSLSSKCSLKQHLRSHRQAFECSLCEKRFGTRKRLDLHVRVHHTKERFECDFCAKSFTYPSQLEMHKQTHSKPFACDQCGMDFAVEEKLDRHVRLKHRNAETAISSSSVYDSPSDSALDSTPTQEQHLQQPLILPEAVAPAAVLKKLECPTCFMEFGAEDQYNNHILQHLTNPYNIPLQL